jgi:hypothetical protein
MTNFRALCAELADSVELLLEMRSNDRPMRVTEDRLNRARDLLAQPEPQGPTDEELLRIYRVATPCYQVEEYRRELDFARAVLARWGRPATTGEQQ